MPNPELCNPGMRAGALFWKWALSLPADPKNGLKAGTCNPKP